MFMSLYSTPAGSIPYNTWIGWKCWYLKAMRVLLAYALSSHKRKWKMIKFTSKILIDISHSNSQSFPSQKNIQNSEFSLELSKQKRFQIHSDTKSIKDKILFPMVMQTNKSFFHDTWHISTSFNFSFILNSQKASRKNMGNRIIWSAIFEIQIINEYFYLSRLPIKI